MKLAGKIALVSGSGRGIGRATAHKFVLDGARVVVNDLDEDICNEVVAEIRAIGGEAVACTGSVTDVDFGPRFVQTANDNYGRLDIIVNNAGYAWDGVIQRMTDEQFDAMLDIHLKAPFRILRAASHYLRGTARQVALRPRRNWASMKAWWGSHLEVATGDATGVRVGGQGGAVWMGESVATPGQFAGSAAKRC